MPEANKCGLRSFVYRKVLAIVGVIMKKICVITATRAEYGLLYPLLKEIDMTESLELQLVVSGTHLSSEYGSTKQEIVNDGFRDFDEIDIMTDSVGEENEIASRIMATAISQFASYLTKKRPDLAVILGDRYEMMAFAIALVNANVPIAHLNGGEVTGGALDEIYRHCITKMSTLHFANCDLHKKRIIQLGEPSQRVFNVGDLCVDNIKNTVLLSKEQLEHEIGINFDTIKIILITFHPVTMENNSLEQLENMLKVIERKNKYFYIFTKANSDRDGIKINQRIGEFVEQHKNCRLIDSLGRVRYLSILQYASAVMGNSSSGLYEVPYFHIPTINIGNRQKGRLHGETVIDCYWTEKEINEAFEKAMSTEFRSICRTEESFFGNGDTAQQVVDIIKKSLKTGINIRKTFCDVNFE